MVSPKKYLGQHFLTDDRIAGRIARLLPDDDDISVMEIGPGKGILTGHLLSIKTKKFLAVDIDRDAILYLGKKYPEKRHHFIHQDFLKMDSEVIHSDRWHIIGNFPYNISSQIFFKVLNNRQHILSVTCMIQKEVAQRIVSPPGSRTYGILSVILQAYFDVRHEFNVKPGSFFPPPKVISSVITLKRNDNKHLACNEELFLKIVKTTFNQRRKTIKNSLKTILLNLDGENELLFKRPEQLGVDEFVELTNWSAPRLKSHQ